MTGEVLKSRGDPKEPIDSALPRISTTAIRERVAFHGGSPSSNADVFRALRDLLDDAGFPEMPF